MEMANLLDFTKALFGSDEMWKKITNEDKIKYSFIVNRMMSKKYPHLSQMANSKYCDRASSMDIYHFMMKNTGYNNWFWDKKKTKTDEDNKKPLPQILQISENYNKREIEIVDRFYKDKL